MQRAADFQGYEFGDLYRLCTVCKTTPSTNSRGALTWTEALVP